MPQALIYSGLALLFGVLNGLVHITADALIDRTTIRALIVALATATITGAFGLAIALVQRNADRALHDRLDRLESRTEDVAGTVGANKRATDPNATGTTPTE